MKYICDAPDGKTWFRLETQDEAEQESEKLKHAVGKHFRREREKAEKSFKSPSKVSFESNIGLEAHIQREMPLFLTLRDGEGKALVTAMLPPGGRNTSTSKIMIVGPANADPWPDHKAAIGALAKHFDLTLDRETCFPYK